MRAFATFFALEFSKSSTSVLNRAGSLRSPGFSAIKARRVASDGENVTIQSYGRSVYRSILSPGLRAARNEMNSCQDGIPSPAATVRSSVGATISARFDMFLYCKAQDRSLFV